MADVDKVRAIVAEVRAVAEAQLEADHPLRKVLDPLCNVLEGVLLIGVANRRRKLARELMLAAVRSGQPPFPLVEWAVQTADQLLAELEKETM